MSEGIEAKEHKDAYISVFLNDFYSAKHDEGIILQKSNDIINVLNSHIQKNKNKMSEWDKELSECENKDTLKKYGELLKADCHNLSQGKKRRYLIIIPTRKS